MVEPRYHVGVTHGEWREHVGHLVQALHVGYLYLPCKQPPGADESRGRQASKSRELVWAHVAEEAAPVGHCAVGVCLLGHILAQQRPEVTLATAQTDVVRLGGEEQVEVEDAQTVGLHHLVLLQVGQDVQHAVAGSKGGKGGDVSHSRSN